VEEAVVVDFTVLEEAVVVDLTVLDETVVVDLTVDVDDDVLFAVEVLLAVDVGGGAAPAVSP